MINPATQPQDQLNPFTQMVKSLGTLWDDPELYGNRDWVRLHNGALVRPKFMPAEDEYCIDCFGTDEYRWNLDGTSVTRIDYDMMEIVNE